MTSREATLTRLADTHKHGAKRQGADVPASAADHAGPSNEGGGAKTGLPLFLHETRAEGSAPRPGFLQAKLDGGADGDARGAGGGSPAPMSFPHASRIRGALRTDATLEGVFDPAGCAARGTPAFTDGEVTHFAAESPGLHVAAHEAAHQLQHAGVAHDFGLGAEGHASAVADAVASGASAAGLVGRTGARVASARRNYVEADAQGNPQEKGPARLSETGETLTYNSQTAYATEALIQQSNGILQARNSGVKISSAGGGPSVTVDAPDGTGAKPLSLVKVEIKADKTGATMPGDCREAAIEVMGKTGDEFPEEAVCRWGGEPMLFEPPSDKIDSPRADFNAMLNFIDRRVRETPNYDALSPEEQRKVREKAVSDFTWKVTKEREKLRHVSIPDERAKQLGVDKFAAPKVGQAYGLILAKPPAMGSDAMHYAGVIMAPGSDRVTLENMGTAPGVRTDKWFINTYGTLGKPNQSFHERYLSNEERHTFVMQTKAQPPDYAGKIASMGTYELFARYRASAVPDERGYVERELRGRSVLVDVRVNKTEDVFSDDVYVLVGNGGGLGWSSGVRSFSEGQSHTFSLQLSKVWPVGETLFVNLFDFDLTGDDLIGVINWAAPFFPKSDVPLSNGEASYTVSLTMSGGSLAAPSPPPP